MTTEDTTTQAGIGPRITFVVPYPSLYEVVHEFIRELAESPIEFETIHLVGVKQVHEYSFRSDVVVARGITCAAIREAHPEITTVEIPVTGYDVIRAIQEARSRYNSKCIALIGTDSLINGANELSEFLQTDIRCYTVTKDADAERAIRSAVKSGADSVIGGLMVYDVAKELEVPATWIRSGHTALRQATGEAVLAAKVQIRERERSAFLKAVLDYTHEAILAVDREGNVTTANRTAQTLLQTETTSLMGTHIRQLPQLHELARVLQDGHQELGSLQHTDSGLLAANFVPIVVGNDTVGAVATFQPATAIQDVERRIRHSSRAKGLSPKYRFEDIQGESSEIRRVIDTARRFSSLDSNVLIIGETGTGKELFAHSIHRESTRSSGPFVALNCAALPESLLESELFGYTDGAFTGAKKGGKAGLFEQAHEGTIFLDEIAEIPLTLQAKLLRVLQEREIRRLGADYVVPIDVRVIAATNENLKEMLGEGRFRADLLYRIDVLRISIPPLRRRPRDVTSLATHFLRYFSMKFRDNPARFTREAGERMVSYAWPGNARELINVCERLAALADTDTVDDEQVAAALDGHPTGIEQDSGFGAPAQPAMPSAGGAETQASLREAERTVILAELQRNHYHKGATAKSLGISRSTLWRKLRAL